ncbi:glucose 1-dehydrogenase [candidate division KSB3 bacterium]|uniref:Glucose 1-dehydrogenase n=1 Tax=candidate division KSB3 bacterium TaxID=2044937 RepID=A0A9D5Q827_9BACT|nr:glucose 1-dehydrogenase [candidate division KSB3 bacterium]
MEQRFAQKVAVVTGAGQGIGRGIALRLAQEGADVVVADIQEEKAQQTAQDIQALGRQALAYQINLANVAEIQPMVDTVVKECGRIDILVNSAGIVQSKPLLEITEAEWDRMVAINLKGLFFCIQAVGAQMIAQVPEDVKAAGQTDRCYGKIVNLSSISGRRGRAYQTHYSATKAAIISVTQSAALAFTPYNINVNAIAPSVVLTPMWEQNIQDKSRMTGIDARKESEEFINRIPLQRPGSPEDMAAAAAFLCSAEADYITGQTLNVDGGFEMD